MTSWSLSKLHFIQAEKSIRRTPIRQASYGRLIMAAMTMAAAVTLLVAASVTVYVTASSVSLSVMTTAAVNFLVTSAAATVMISASDAVTAVIVSPVILVRRRMSRRRVALR
jgi:predicted MFS family arabinose efflux permease